MKIIKAIVVDDEKRARNVLSQLLFRNFDNLEVVAQCSDVPSAAEQIKQLKPDLVFLDIQMPNYAGYELVNFFDEINFEIIFVTAFDHYAIKAFEFGALDYLVKPINRSRLIDAVKRVEQKVNIIKYKNDYDALLKSIKEKEFKKIIIPESGNRRIVELKNIIALKAEGAYTRIYLYGEKEIFLGKNLKYFENKLGKDDGFFRSHRAWIVNLNHVESINKTELGLILTNNIKAKISRIRLEAFQIQIA